MLTRIARTASIVFWVFAYGFAVFFVGGVTVFAWARGEHRLYIALCAMAVLTMLAVLVYAIRVKLRFNQDWRGLSPREIGKRVYFVLFNGPGSANQDVG